MLRRLDLASSVEDCAGSPRIAVLLIDMNPFALVCYTPLSEVLSDDPAIDSLSSAARDGTIKQQIPSVFAFIGPVTRWRP